MKKKWMGLAAAMLAAAVLGGCTTKAPEIKTGIGTYTTLSDSKNANEDRAGTAQVDLMSCALVVDTEGKIVSVSFDATSGKVQFDTDGIITTDLAAEPKSKKELGDAYGMKKSSGIGKEWYQQAEALENWMKGKKVSDVLSMKLYDTEKTSGAPDVEDLKSSVTISATPFLKALEKGYAAVE